MGGGGCLIELLWNMVMLIIFIFQLSLKSLPHCFKRQLDDYKAQMDIRYHNIIYWNIFPECYCKMPE